MFGLGLKAINLEFRRAAPKGRANQCDAISLQARPFADNVCKQVNGIENGCSVPASLDTCTDSIPDARFQCGLQVHRSPLEQFDEEPFDIPLIPDDAGD